MRRAWRPGAALVALLTAVGLAGLAPETAVAGRERSGTLTTAAARHALITGTPIG